MTADDYVVRASLAVGGCENHVRNDEGAAAEVTDTVLNGDGVGEAGAVGLCSLKQEENQS